jgi:hypothetical protein
VSISYKVTQGQVYRTARLEELAKELPKLQGEKRLEALAEVATALSGVATKYESAALDPSWQKMAREIIIQRDFKKIADLSREIMSHPKGSDSFQTNKEREHVERLRATLKPALDESLKTEQILSKSQSKGIER